MLHIKTVEPETLSVLKRLQALPELSEFYLAGGTAMYPKYEVSVAIDLHGGNFDKEKVLLACQREFREDFYYEGAEESEDSISLKRQT